MVKRCPFLGAKKKIESQPLLKLVNEMRDKDNERKRKKRKRMKTFNNFNQKKIY